MTTINKTPKFTWTLFAAAAASAALLSGCVVEGDEVPVEDVESSEQATAASPGAAFCQSGMRTETTAMDRLSPRCDLAQLADLVNFVCSSSDPANAAVCNFLHTEVAGNALIECSQYIDDTGSPNWCANVVDRHVDGTPLENGAQGGGGTGLTIKNYFLAYANDDHHPMVVPEVAHWDNALLMPHNTMAPIELSEAAFITFHPFSGTYNVLKAPASPSPDVRYERVFKFDPRTCGDCGGVYSGPNFSWLSNPAELITYSWYPGFSSLSCNFETSYFGSTAVLPRTECTNEAVWRIGR